MNVMIAMRRTIRLYRRIALILTSLAALLAVSGVLSPPSNAFVRMVTWSYAVNWFGTSDFMLVDEYGGGGVHTEAVINGFTTGIGTAYSGEVIGVDPNITASPGVEWASCTLYIGGTAVLSDSAARGDGTDVECLWVVG